LDCRASSEVGSSFFRDLEFVAPVVDVQSRLVFGYELDTESLIRLVG
jgi:hypothetical protein